MSWVAVGTTVVGAGMGYMESKKKQKQQERSGNAAADATAVSWARKDGKGSIPDIQWNDTSLMGNTAKGGLSGFMMGNSIKGGMGGADAAGGAAPATASGTGVEATNMNMGFSDQLAAQNPAMDMSGGMGMQTMQKPTIDWNTMGAQPQQGGYFGQPTEFGPQTQKPNFYAKR